MVSKFDTKLKTPLEWKDLNKIRKINSINSKLEEICKEEICKQNYILENTHIAYNNAKSEYDAKSKHDTKNS